MLGNPLCRSTTRAVQAALALATLLAAAALAPSPAPGAVPSAGPAMRVSDAAAMDLGAGRQVPGEAIVRYERGAAPAERRRARERAAAELGEQLELPRAELVEVEGSVQAAIRRLERQPGVAFAQPNYRYEALAVPAPNDTFFGELWGLSDPQLPNPGVSALDAWESNRGDGQIIAVVDTGVDLTHPDIVGNLWSNPSPDPIAQDVHGYDFVDDDGDPDDYQFHGTHVAATAAATADNNQGISGVAPEAQIMAVRALDGDGNGSTADIASGIIYAADRGASVINLSLGGPAGTGDLIMSAAIDAAAAKDALVVAAAGNDGANNDVEPTTPCVLPQENLICVAALNQAGSLAGFSNFGAESVDLAAPGTSILSAKTDYGPDPPLFSDGFELGLGPLWSTEAFDGGIEWGESSLSANGLKSAADSPVGNYGQAPSQLTEAESFLYTSAAIDLTGERGCRLHFATMYEIEEFFDAFAAGASSQVAFDGWFVDGTSPGYPKSFVHEEASISDLDGRSDVHPIFAIFSDEEVELDGAYVDDVRLLCRDETYVNAIAPIGVYDQPNSGNYVRFNGTSMAAPHVSGVAALVRSAQPAASATEVVDAILEGTSQTPSPNPARPTATGGIADACQAIAVVTEGDVAASCPGSTQTPSPPPSQTATGAAIPSPSTLPPPELADRVAPRAFFRQRPPRVVRTRFKRAKVVFRFGSNERGVRFLCRLDGRPWRFCKARFVKRLRVGRHVIRVKARDAAGNTTRRAAVHRFRIVRVGRSR